MPIIPDITFPDPGPLGHADVTLRLEERRPADSARGRVPSCSFGVHLPDGTRCGRITLRVGDTENILRVAGHIGYGIDGPYRGHHRAASACFALRPFVRTYYEQVVITCDPDNIASIRTLERIGAVYLDTLPVPRTHDAFLREGSTAKRRYLWRVGPPSQAGTGRDGQ